jgi:hypothetical protein
MLLAKMTIGKDVPMKRVSMACPLLIVALALVSLPAGLRAQGENLIAMKTLSESIDALNARSESPATQSVKSLVPESQPILQPGTPKAAGQVPAGPWSMPWIPTYAPRANRTKWISVGPGSLPLADALQPDATQKYTSTPTVLQVHFGHQP